MRKHWIVPLTGKRLLQKVKKLPYLSKREKAKECGYYHFTEQGSVKVDLKPFLEALLAAADPEMTLEAAPETAPRRLTYIAKVNKNGQILIRSAYTRLMDLTPGDQFEIKLGYKHIHLIQIVEEDEVDNVDEGTRLAA